MTRLSTCMLLGCGLVAHGFRARSRKHLSKEGPLQPEVLPDLGDVLPDPDSFAQCHLSTSECSIDSMTEPTLVYVDDDHSLCYNGDKFAFLVRPGARDKLLFYLPGGGACFEFPFLIPGGVPTCVPNFQIGLAATGITLGGVMDVENPKNAFRDYTVVSPPYCSGAAHVGNTTIESALATRYQYGYNNNEHSRAWAVKNLRPTLKNFVLMGSSAGALGSSVWADFLLEAFTYEKGSVILDSYMAVFPEDTQGPIVKNFESCNLPIFRRAKERCEAGEFNLQDFLDGVIARYPKVAFAHLQCKGDLVQRAFYKTVALAFLRPDFFITERGFYRETNDMMQRYNKNPNYVAYLVDGAFHTFAQWNWWYSASIAGESKDPPEGTPALWEWVGELVEHEAVTSQCNGPRKPNGWHLITGQKYCDEKVFPKTLSVAR